MTIDDLAQAILARRPAEGTFIVGVTGAVASGKSTLAAALAPLLGHGDDPIGTDGFLLPNAVIDARGLTMKKGFPETYDLAALAAALERVRSGVARFPAYSHATYDVDPGTGVTRDRPGILIVEGLALGLERPERPRLIDCLIYIEADETDLEAWFVARFLGLWDAAADDPASFYRRFHDRDRAGAEALARAVWSGINLPNLRQHIAPVRAHADVVAVKAADHSLIEIRS